MRRSNTYNIETPFSNLMEHGEGPIWNVAKSSYLWVDLLKGELYTGNIKTNQTNKIGIGCALGAVGLISSNHMVMATEKGFGTYAYEDSVFNLIEPKEDYINDSFRFNDGRVGPDGSFFAGTMEWNGLDGFGKLIKLAPDKTFEIISEAHAIPNGMGWNMANDTFFMIDTGHHCMYAFDFNIKDGKLSGKRVFKQFGTKEFPDGMAMDKNNHFWIAIWGGSKILHLDEKGGEVEEIKLPVPYPTSCCFGGEKLNELFITSSRLPLSEQQKADDQLSGNCFLIYTDTEGKEEYQFAK